MARVRVQVPVGQPEQPQQPEVQADGSQIPGPRARQLFTRSNLVIAGVVFVVVIVMFSLLSDRKKLEDKVNKLSTTQATTPQNDAQKYQDAVSKLVEVPSAVTPTVKVPTQDEITSLSKDNGLYSTAKVGDVFLVYINQDKSLFLVIYRPSDSKVILAAQATTSQTAKP